MMMTRMAKQKIRRDTPSRLRNQDIRRRSSLTTPCKPNQLLPYPSLIFRQVLGLLLMLFYIFLCVVVFTVQHTAITQEEAANAHRHGGYGSLIFPRKRAKPIVQYIPTSTNIALFIRRLTPHNSIEDNEQEAYHDNQHNTTASGWIRNDD